MKVKTNEETENLMAYNSLESKWSLDEVFQKFCTILHSELFLIVAIIMRRGEKRNKGKGERKQFWIEINKNELKKIYKEKSEYAKPIDKCFEVFLHKIFYVGQYFGIRYIENGEYISVPIFYEFRDDKKVLRFYYLSEFLSEEYKKDFIKKYYES